MASNRREFIQAGAFGAAMLATGPVAFASRTGGARPLDILVLGGTGFIGPHMVREALRRGHSVTLFNRGRSNPGVFPDLETIVGDRDGGLDGLRNRRWDVVIDNSGYIPRHVRDSARLLADSVEHYLFVSSVSVYADFTRDLDEDGPLGQLGDAAAEEVTNATYGPLKALCESAVREQLGGERAVVLRPTYICGPGDNSDRLTWWPVRTARGGDMLWPGRPGDPIQIIDVRDLATFTIDSLEQRMSGTFNMAIPEGSYTMGELLTDCKAVTGSDVDEIWVDEDFVDEARRRHTVRNRGMLPVWHPQRGENAMPARFLTARAQAAGLHTRPVRETLRDLMAWWQTLPVDRTAALAAGMSAEFEAEMIALWRAASA